MFGINKRLETAKDAVQEAGRTVQTTAVIAVAALVIAVAALVLAAGRGGNHG